MGLTQTIGEAAEREARHYLEQQGLVFVSANWRVHFHKQVGEIDLIMRH
ncbi:MAG: YraN family protein, partial [Burkholderiales bacterium]|nr:YraN family protein [Burkholderiales bacterium]